MMIAVGGFPPVEGPAEEPSHRRANAVKHAEGGRVEDRTQQEQASPETEARIRGSYERQGLMSHLGARIAHIAPGRVHPVLPSRPEVTQQHGYLHAGATGATGATGAIADSAGGHAAFTLFPENTEVLNVEYKINLLAPAVGDHLEAAEQ